MAFNLDFYAPYFEIKIGGEIQNKLKNAIVSLTVDDDIEKSSMFNLVLNDSFDINTKKFAWLDSELLEPEKSDVEIYINYANRPQKEEPLIKGRITSLAPNFPSTGIPTLTVQGYGKSYFMQKAVGKEPRIFLKEKNYGDIADKIKTRNQLAEGEIEHSTIKPCDEIEMDHKINDYHFLKKLANRIGFEFFIRNDKLYFRKPKDVTGKVSTLTWRKNLISFNPMLNTADMVSTVHVKGHNQEKPAKPIKSTATLKDIGVEEPVAESSAELTEQEFPICDKKHAEALAKALLERKNNNLLTGTCECVGDPDYIPGTVVEVEGVGKKFSGKYYITGVRHSIGDGGYTASLEVRKV